MKDEWVGRYVLLTVCLRVRAGFSLVVIGRTVCRCHCTTSCKTNTSHTVLQITDRRKILIVTPSANANFKAVNKDNQTLPVRT